MRAWSVVVLVAACGGGRAQVPDDLDEDLSHPADTTRVQYTLWWNGARIGDADLRVTRDDHGVHLSRAEHVQLMRGGALAASRLTIDVQADRTLRASEVDVANLGDGGSDGRATRARDGTWQIAVDGEKARSAPADVVPDELVPMIVARDHHFRGDVMLSGRGFAIATLEVRRSGDGYDATLTVPGGVEQSKLSIDPDGMLDRASGADGVVAVRALAADVAQPFDPPEIVDATAIPVAGEIDPDATHVSLALSAIAHDAPPALPGQTVKVEGDRWGVVLDPSLPGGPAADPAGADRSDDIAELAKHVTERITDDLSTTVTTMDQARHAKSGDCTTHALLFAALAGDAGIDARIVTGFRLDGGRLVRHRWAIAWNGSAWMSVDPTFGEAPARSYLFGLAVSSPRSDDLGLADEAVFAGTGGVRAKVVTP
jgi:hypothetical protein